MNDPRRIEEGAQDEVRMHLEQRKQRKAAWWALALVGMAALGSAVWRNYAGGGDQ